LIEVKDISFRYPGNNEDTLKGLNFSIERGAVFGFLGPSGSGKSTTQKLLYKLLHKYQGEALFKGKSLTDWSRDFYEQIGVSFELPNLYTKLSAEENLQFFSAFYKNSNNNIHELLEQVGLKDDAKKLVSDFSKGMKMRLNFIRAIMHDPTIIFFDEPTAGLDPVNARKIKDHIVELKKQGKTIFITTHNMTTADELCDRLSFIVDGVIQVTESPDKLKQSYGKSSVKVILTNGETTEFPLAGLGQNEAFTTFIKKGTVERINTLEASLEEVFIQITGKALSQ